MTPHVERAWIAALLPPLALLAAVGLGLFLDRLALGPRGFFIVLVLIGPGAWALALVCAAGIIEVLSRGSMVTKLLLWGLEIALCLLTYSLVSPLLGPGWG